MLFRADKFTGGLNTHKDADHLSPDEGVTAQDCMVGTGSLQPLPALVTAAPSGACNALRLKLDNPTWGVVEYGGETYISGDGAPRICNGRTLGINKPTTDNFIVEQVNTPDVIGPSEDGSGSFTSLGQWVPTEYPQSNTWVYTNLDTGAQTTTVDAWTVCDSPPFNISRYYALKQGLASLETNPPAVNEYGCAANTASCSTNTGPITGANPLYLEEDTSYAISFWNEDLKEESTISETYEFKHTPYVRSVGWQYGPLEGHAVGSDMWSTSYPDPTTHRGNTYEHMCYTGTSHLHQVKITVVGLDANATHVIVYQKIRGSYIAIAKLTAGQSITVTAQTRYDDLELLKFYAHLTKFEPPPSNLAGLVLAESGVFAGYVGNEIYLSYPFSPDLWSDDYKFKIPWNVKSITPFYSEFVVTTDGHPVRLIGQTPGKMSVVEMPDNESNLNGRSTFKLGRMIGWASPEGVAMFNGSEVKVVTRGNLSRTEWRAIIADTSTLVGTGTEEVYILFHSNGALVLDMRPESAAMTTYTITATSAVYDITQNLIYLNGDRALSMSFPPPAGKGTYKGIWKSGRIETMDHSQAISVCRVASDGQVLIRVRNDKGEEFAGYADGRQPFRIGVNGGPIRGSWYEYDLEFRHAVRKVDLASSFEELKRG